MATATIQMRIDADLKKEAEEAFADMGMTLPAAITMLCKQVINQGELPFKVIRSSQNRRTELARGKAAFDRLRIQATSMPEMTMEEIDEEIRQARLEREARRQ